jgi:Xaa-Pro aminopeptidase
MLNDTDYMKAFLAIQKKCLDATHLVSSAAVPGVSEKDLADIYETDLAQDGITEFWYPTLICAGQYSGQPLTRRNHLPSADVTLRDNDIVILDVTPMQKTIWGNWTITKSVGNNPFYKNLCADLFAIVTEAAAEAIRGGHSGLGDIYHGVMAKAKARGLESIDPRGNVGHSIFQVEEGQSVDKVPLEARAFIDENDSEIGKRFLISIEPELARVNPADGVRYGGKFQFIVPVGYGDLGTQLINAQLEFYRDMVRHENDPAMKEALGQAEKKIAGSVSVNTLNVPSY